MNFYVKATYLKPVENSEKLKRHTETYLVNAMSVTEAETRVKNWVPSNFQDPEVTASSKAKIVDVNRANSESDVWWTAKVAYDDIDGRSKPFTVAVNGDTIMKALLALEKLYVGSFFYAISDSSVIYDEDLLEKVGLPEVVESEA
jgi:hypothetical protein